MKKYMRLAFIAAAVLLYGCTSTQQTVEESSPEVRYSLVYVIHADANYTYHVDGNRRKADLDVLNKAIETGRNAKHGEVFIFHQKPENKLMFLIPKKDRDFYHFRNGELAGGRNYSPKNGGLKAEAEIYNKKRAASAQRNVFLYFGHEIPTGEPHLVYHQSQAYRQFNTKIFSNDLRLFNERFDLTVLSTCNNGNPLMVEALTGMTDYLVASPQNLHLSHLADEPLQRLETDPDISSEQLADDIAQESFERLSSFLQTAVTAAVYNLDQTEKYISSLARGYQNHLQKIHQNSLFINNRDCKTLPEFNKSLPQDGVTLYYKAPAFGQRVSAGEHSGWGCKM